MYCIEYTMLRTGVKNLVINQICIEYTRLRTGVKNLVIKQMCMSTPGYELE